MLGPDGPVTEAMLTADSPITPQIRRVLRGELQVCEARGTPYSLGYNLYDLFQRVLACFSFYHATFTGPAEIVPGGATWPDLHLSAAVFSAGLSGGAPINLVAADVTLTRPAGENDAPITNYVYYDLETEVYAASATLPTAGATILLYKISAYHSTWEIATDYRGLLWCLGDGAVGFAMLDHPEPSRSIRLGGTVNVSITDGSDVCTVDLGFSDSNIETQRAVKLFLASADEGAPLATGELSSVTATTGSLWQQNAELTEFDARTDADGLLSLEFTFAATATYWLIIDFDDGRLEWVGPIEGVVTP